jgi:hypothetical protein
MQEPKAGVSEIYISFFMGNPSFASFLLLQLSTRKKMISSIDRVFSWATCRS